MHTPRVTFRIKMLGIVGITILAFAATVISGDALGHQVERQLDTIQTSYMPKLDLEPQLDAELDRIARGFQDAVATHDPDVLRETSESKTRFIQDLDAAGSAVEPQRARELRDALNGYYDSAYDVSKRMIADETGEGIVAAVSAMQAKQARVAEKIKSTTAIDRRALADAFAESVHAEARARTYQFWIGVACLTAILTLSFILSRNLIVAVSTLAEGLRRFGEGDFRQPIALASNDEFGDLAIHANYMAESLSRLDRARARAETALKASNRELEAFSYSVAHDLRAPLRGINGFSHALMEDYAEKLDGGAREYLNRIASAAGRMGELIDALLAFSRLSRAELQRKTIDMTRLAESVVEQLRSSQPERNVELMIEPGVEAFGDPTLMRTVLENLLGNAWKFTGKREGARISFGLAPSDDANERTYFVRDNGAGFDMEFAGKLFAPFQRLHSANQFAGTGIGLASVQRIIERHGGRIRAEGKVGQGARFEFTLPTPTEGALS